MKLLTAAALLPYWDLGVNSLHCKTILEKNKQGVIFSPNSWVRVFHE